MRVTTFLLLVLLLAAVGAAGYFWQLGQLVDDKSALYEEWNYELRFTVDALKAENATLQAQLDAEVSKLSEEKEVEIKRLKAAQGQLIEELKGEIEQQEIQITQMADRLSVRLADQILFPSGKAELTEAGIKVLERVGNIIVDVKDQIIRVEGHTDNIPIHPRLKNQFSSNWELSAARAINVVQLLQESSGINPEMLEAVGLGEFHPVASNKTRNGRQKNRRIEIILAPVYTVKKALSE